MMKRLHSLQKNGFEITVTGINACLECNDIQIKKHVDSCHSVKLPVLLTVLLLGGATLLPMLIKTQFNILFKKPIQHSSKIL